MVINYCGPSTFCSRHTGVIIRLSLLSSSLSLGGSYGHQLVLTRVGPIPFCSRHTGVIIRLSLLSSSLSLESNYGHQLMWTQSILQAPHRGHYQAVAPVISIIIRRQLWSLATVDTGGIQSVLQPQHRGHYQGVAPVIIIIIRRQLRSLATVDPAHSEAATSGSLSGCRSCHHHYH